MAIEVWAIDKGYTFGNILLDNDDSRAAKLREQVFLKKHEHQVSSKGEEVAKHRRRRGEEGGRR